jgi:hypothetical protein
MMSSQKSRTLASGMELNGMEILTTANEWRSEVQPWQSREKTTKLQPVQASHVTTFQFLDTKGAA